MAQALRCFVRSFRSGMDKRMSFSAAAVAFYMMTGLVPLLVATLLTYGIVADAGDVLALVDRLRGVLPPESLNMVQSVVLEVVSERPGGGTLATGIAISLWSGSKATEGLILGLHTAYDAREKRSLVVRKMVAIGLSLVVIVGVVMLAALLVVLPVLVTWLQLEGVWNAASAYLRWPVLVLLIFAGLAVIYRFGVRRREVTWPSVLPGAILGACLSTGASALFTWYASSFANYGKSYGSLAAVILLLLWCYLNAVVVLLGAHFNVAWHARGEESAAQ